MGIKKAGFEKPANLLIGAFSLCPAETKGERKNRIALHRRKSDDSCALVQDTPREAHAGCTPFGTVPFGTGIKRLWQPILRY